jgi:hypothetical protein
MAMFKREGARRQRSQIRERVISDLTVAAIVASGLTAVAVGLTIWLSTLPAISPVSLSLAFHSWLQVFTFNFVAWLCIFSMCSTVMLIRFLRWVHVDRHLGHCDRCPEL